MEREKNMPRFDINSYETVEERIRRFYDLHPSGRITTECVVAGVNGTWLFKAYIYLTEGDQAADLPKATGYASESEGGPQSEWKAELGETSAIGRALANMNLSGNKRASREEMQKVARHENRDWLAEGQSATDVDALRLIWGQAKQAGASKAILSKLEARADELGSGGGGRI
jgi:hypothetical protein